MNTSTEQSDKVCVIAAFPSRTHFNLWLVRWTCTVYRVLVNSIVGKLCQNVEFSCEHGWHPLACWVGVPLRITPISWSLLIRYRILQWNGRNVMYDEQESWYKWICLAFKENHRYTFKTHFTSIDLYVDINISPTLAHKAKIMACCWWTHV